MTVLDRLLSRTDKTGTCWLWTGATADGYGRMIIEPGSTRLGLTHRLAYEAMVGPIPDGMQVDHLCRVRACLRPDHLEPVTAAENNARSTSVTAVNARKTHCTRGHKFTAENTKVREGRRYCRECIRVRNAARKQVAA